jgi:hypothetical protein
MKSKTHSAYALIGKGGTFIAAFRFRPKRVHQGKKGEGYYAWTDCNGPRYDSNKMKHGRGRKYAENAIEGSMNARCVPVSITLEEK